MINFDEKLKLTSFMLQIAEWERQSECVRQVLNGLKDFEPYAAFTRIARENYKGKISADEIQLFLRQNGHEIPLGYCEQLIKLYDTNFDGELAFDEFLMMVLARDNPDLRFTAAQRENYEVDYSNKLSFEIEYTITRLFLKEIDYISKTCNDILVFSNLEAIFHFLDQNQSQHLDYENLKQFFVDVNIQPLEEELVNVLRKMDIDDDGRINLNEFLYFMSLFRPQGVSQELQQVMTQTYQDYHISPHKRSPAKDSTSIKQNTQITEVINQSIDDVSSIKNANQGQQGVSNTQHTVVQEFNTTSVSHNISGIEKQSQEGFRPSNTEVYKRSAPRPSNNRQEGDKTLYVYNHHSEIKNEVNPQQYRSNNNSFRDRSVRESQHQVYQQKYLKKDQHPLESNFDSMYIENNLNVPATQLSESIEKRANPIPRRDQNDVLTQNSGVVLSHRNGGEDVFVKKTNVTTTSTSTNQRVNQGRATRSIIDNNPKLLKALAEMIEIEKSIEGAKQELALRPDYNLKDHFRSVDTLNRGLVNFKCWQLFLTKLKVSSIEKIALSERLFAIADLDQDSQLCFNEFAEFFQPIQQEYKVLLGCRVEKSLAGNFDFDKLFTEDTKRVMRNVLHFMLESVRVANESREQLGLSEEELHELFDSIDMDQDQVITISEMNDYLVKNKLMITKREISLLFSRLDLDKDQVISRDEFMSWFLN